MAITHGASDAPFCVPVAAYVEFVWLTPLDNAVAVVTRWPTYWMTPSYARNLIEYRLNELRQDRGNRISLGEALVLQS